MRFIEVEIHVKEDGEFGQEDTTRGFIDVGEIESFYQDKDNGCFIGTKSGDEFKVANDVEYILDAVNERDPV